jgi:toxin ParE1/3/4
VNVVWLRQAERDLDSAIDYIAAHNPAAALQLYRAVREKTGLLPDNPGIGRPGRVEGTRELVIYPFIVAYAVQADLDAIVILRLLHGARKWPDDMAH